MTSNNKRNHNKRNYSIVAIVAAVAISTLVLAQTSAEAAFIQSQSEVIPRSVDPFVFELAPGSVDGIHYTLVRDGGMPEAALQKSTTVTLPLIVRPTGLQELSVDFTTTFGGQLESPKMPPGVHVTLEPSKILLKPGKDSLINIIVQVDSNAPDGLYMQNIVGKWGGPNDFSGTSISLKIGQGSVQFLSPGDVGQ